MKNYYKILGVIPTAEIIVIKAAYRALSQKYHPDKNRDEAEKYQKKMQELNEAYCVKEFLMKFVLLNVVTAFVMLTGCKSEADKCVDA